MDSDPAKQPDSEELTFRAFSQSDFERGEMAALPLPGITTVMPSATGAGPSKSSDPGALGLVRNQEPGPVRSDGVVFGKYRLLRKLGDGGMGTVWLVEHIRLGHARALKIIVSEVTDNPINRRRFEQEGKILAKLSKHPNAVPVHDSDFVDGFAYIEMDYQEGSTLRARLDAGKTMPLDDVRWILRELCDVLGAAHGLGIVHRDIKPQNIMIVPDPSTPRGERVKVLDFGIAKIVRDGAADTGSLTMQTEGSYLGTVPYSSPEQLGLPGPAGTDPVVDHRSDIYSLGVLLYEMLVGVRPFSGNRTQLMFHHAHTPPPPFAVRAPDAEVPPAIEAVVLQCLEKDPAKRPQSVHELFEIFDKAIPPSARLEELSTVSAEPPHQQVSDQPRPLDKPVKPSSRETRITKSVKSGVELVRRRPRRAVFGLLSGAGVIGLTFAGISMWRPNPDPGSSVSRSSGRDLVGPTIPPRIQNWLDDHHLERVGKDLSQDWPTEVKRTDRTSQHLVLLGAYYLPKGYEPDSPSGTGKGGLPKVLKSHRDDDSRFILIEGDEFTMGAFGDHNRFETDEEPGHRVKLSTFYMQESEVTIGQFERFCKDHGFKELHPMARPFFDAWAALKADKGLAPQGIPQYPATGVSHELAEQYAREIGGELPSEAQWEFAARSGGQERVYVWGNDRKGLVEGKYQKANLNNADGQLSSVFAWPTDTTDQGILGLTGNAREWCRDYWQSYPSKIVDPDPVVLTPKAKAPAVFVIRGGSFQTPSEFARVTWRSGRGGIDQKASGEGLPDVGFRVVLEVRARPESLPSQGDGTASLDSEKP
jgi:eukaryotic-like serine/threonine-protein kinase